VFEDEGNAGFGPLVLMRHVSTLYWGTKRLLDALIEKIPDATDVSLWGRAELAATARESTKKAYNERVYGPAFFVNARARPDEGLLALASRPDPFAAMSKGELVAARMDSGSVKPGVLTKRALSKVAARLQKVATPQEALFKGYWELVQGNSLAVAEQSRRFEETLPLPRGVEVRGPSSNLVVDATADIEGHVTLDARLGPIIVDRSASIESFSRLMGPCYIGPKAKIHSALIGGGTSIFDACKVGGQVENSVIMPYTNKAHYGYVGDSYVGSWVNIGAGCTFSNLKNTYGNVRVHVDGRTVDSGMLKLGPAVGDMAKLSIGTRVYSGRQVGTGAHVTGLAGEDVPSFTYYDSISKKEVELLIESVVETQRRMMERRGLTLGRSEESLIRRTHAATARDRRKAGVKKGQLS
jgi:UDP-N-acetylglucosamine diphosphorylase/glucosamine-1-phosphate N-acetyltransferase